MVKLIKVKPFDINYQPDIRPINTVLYQLKEDYTAAFMAKSVYNGKNYSDLYTIEIPMGFYCDGQSVPQFLWWCMRPDGLVRMAALIHDALYRSEGGKQVPIVGGRNDGVIITVKRFGRCYFNRKSCDLIYREFYKKFAPKEKNKANIGYRMLRIFGKKHFGNEMPNG